MAKPIRKPKAAPYPEKPEKAAQSKPGVKKGKR